MRRTNLFKLFRYSTIPLNKPQVTYSKTFRAVAILSLLAVTVIALALYRQAITTAQAQQSTENSEAASLFEANAAADRQTTKPELAGQPVVKTFSDDPVQLSPEGSVCGWSASTVYPVTILDQATVTVGSTLYTFGGVSTAIIANAYKFDGTTWTPIAPLPAALEFPTAVTDGTNIYILGGALVGTGTPQTTVYRYNVASDTYTPLAPFTTGVWNAAAVYLSGKIYKFAGTGPATASTNVLEIYDVAGNSWTAGAVYPLSISFVGAFVQGGFIYGAGGIQSVGSLASLKTFRYDPVANTWDDAAITDLPATRWGAASSITGYGVNNGWVLAGGYVAGVATANISTSVVRWNPTTNVWDTLTSMTGERARMTGAILGTNFYVIGGRSIASPAFVGTNSNQKLLCFSNVAVITAGTATVTSGNNLLEPNECNTLNVPLSNIGDVNATAISAVLSTTTPGITVTQPNSAYPDIPASGGPSNNTTPYQVSISNTVACFTSASFTLTVTYTGGTSPATFNFSLPVGLAPTDYTFSTGTGGTIPAGGTLIPLSQDDDFSVDVPLPAAWSSSVYGVPVTSLSANTNGFVIVNGVGPASGAFTNTTLLAALGGGNPVLFPAWDDYDMDIEDTTNGGIFVNTVGSAPNRELYIEWRAAHFDEPAASAISNHFAVKLTEGSNTVQYIHVLTGVTPNINGTSATVGIQRASTAGSPFTQAGFNTAGTITPGMVRTGTLPAGQCTPGNGPCGAVSVRSRADFDGDGKTDLSVFRPSEGNWYLNESTAGFVVIGWGVSTDTLVPGDYDGDGKTDTAVFRPNANPSQPDFYILNSNGFTVTGVSWGVAADVPVVADYNNDAKSDVAVYRPSSNTWYILNSGGGASTAVFGVAGDVPVAGNFGGSANADFTVYRSSTNSWVTQISGGGVLNYVHGTAGDLLVPADYDGDNVDDRAVYRPSTGQWYVLKSTNGTVAITSWGNSTDVPVPGDYDGDGSDDVAIYRSGQWWVLRSTAGVLVQSFGIGSDTAIPRRYLP